MKKKITFSLTVDTTAHTVEFTQTQPRRVVPIAKAYCDAPAELGEVCRAAAAYFLEAAFLYEHSADFCPPEFSNAERQAQARLMLEEHRNISEVELTAGDGQH